MQDTEIEIESWQSYRDSDPEYISNTKLIYLPQVKYSETQCGASLPTNFEMLLYSMDGKDSYKDFVYRDNRCTYYKKLSSGFYRGYPSGDTSWYPVISSNSQVPYRSLYRDNVLVLDAQYNGFQFECSDKSSSVGTLDNIRLEYEFSDPSDIDAIINCKDEYPEYLNAAGAYASASCRFTDIWKGTLDDRYGTYDGSWTNHFNSTEIKFCIVYSDHRDCTSLHNHLTKVSTSDTPLSDDGPKCSF